MLEGVITKHNTTKGELSIFRELVEKTTTMNWTIVPHELGGGNEEQVMKLEEEEHRARRLVAINNYINNI